MHVARVWKYFVSGFPFSFIHCLCVYSYVSEWTDIGPHFSSSVSMPWDFCIYSNTYLHFANKGLYIGGDHACACAWIEFFNILFAESYCFSQFRLQCVKEWMWHNMTICICWLILWKSIIMFCLSSQINQFHKGLENKLFWLMFILIIWNFIANKGDIWSTQNKSDCRFRLEHQVNRIIVMCNKVFAQQYINSFFCGLKPSAVVPFQIRIINNFS